MTVDDSKGQDNKSPETADTKRHKTSYRKRHNKDKEKRGGSKVEGGRTEESDERGWETKMKESNTTD